MPDNCCFQTKSPWSSFGPVPLLSHYRWHPRWQSLYLPISRLPFCWTHKTVMQLHLRWASLLFLPLLMSCLKLFLLLSPFRWQSHSRLHIHHCRPLPQPGFLLHPPILQWQVRLQKPLPLSYQKKYIWVFYLWHPKVKYMVSTDRFDQLSIRSHPHQIRSSLSAAVRLSYRLLLHFQPLL